jgi:glutamyl-tRNA synthetase
MTKVRTRFAPSPTGYMHIGNLRTALYEYLVAKKEDDGVFILRIEDTDQERLVEGATDIIMETMSSCGLNHDEGPDVGGEFGPYIQSERMKSGIYKEYALKLVELGGAHVCFCDQKDINEQREIAEAKGESFKFDDPCKDLNKDDIAERMKNEDFVIRQNIPTTGTTTFSDEVYGDITVENNTLDEAILLKSDGFPTYNFANIIDDHMMEITHVVRGNEYLASTPKYNLVYEAFNWEIPTYIHCPPVMKDEQHKLSKRNGDASFQDLLNKGFLPEAIINYIALLGWAPETDQEIYSLEELKKAFNVKRINKNGAIFDIEKLKWVNAQYLRNMEFSEYYNLILPYINEAVKKEYDKKMIAEVLQPRVTTLTEIAEMLDFFDEMPEYSTELYIKKKMKTTEENSLVAITAAYEYLKSLESWNYDSIHDGLLALAKQLEIKNGQLLFPATVALSGKKFTPGGCMELAAIFGKEETLKRFEISIALLKVAVNL